MVVLLWGRSVRIQLVRSGAGVAECGRLRGVPVLRAPSLVITCTSPERKSTNVFGSLVFATMPAPDFIIIGGQKCGTTWLRYHLRQHPQVYVPTKEAQFFNRKQHLAKGRDWYESFFGSASPNQVVGDKSPDYLWTTSDGARNHVAGSHERIHEMYPDVKLVVTLRNPVNRAVSALNHLFRRGHVTPIYGVDSLLFGDKQSLIEGRGVIEKGFYYRELCQYLDLFDSDQMLVLLFEEDILQSPQKTLRRLYEFVGVPSDIDTSDLGREQGEHYLSLLGLLLQYYVLPKDLVKVLDRPLPPAKLNPSPDSVLRLYDIYEQENEKLFDLLGRRPASWFRTTAPAGD